VTHPNSAGSAGPGWYPDPIDPGVERWWDGSTWGAPKTPLVPPAKARRPRPVLASTLRGTTRARWALGLGIAALPMLLIPPFGPLVAIAGLAVSILELQSGNRQSSVVWATALSGIGVALTLLVVAVGLASR
jgi:hypothetical protein